MNLEELIDARSAGETLPPLDQLPTSWQDALTAHQVLMHALGETILMPADMTDERGPPQLPDDYAVIREIGRGGMGIVYLAEQRSLARQIAIKVLRPGEMTFGPIVRRFLEEARHLARLRHPHIVCIHEVGTAAGEPYFTMDYIPGRSLAELLVAGPLAPSQAVRILRQAAGAIAHAHGQGIIHRDLKPANLLLTSPPADGAADVLVSDFGLARDLSSDASATVSGMILGTPAYMSPEQARGESRAIGEATDIHALGVILYEMLTGQRPYGSDAPAEVLMRLLHAEATPPRRIDRRIPRDLETICLKAMAKRPEQRYASVQALVADLDRFERGEPILARRSSPLRRVVRLVQQQWKVVAAIAGTALVLIALSPWLFDRSAETLMRWGQEEQAEGNHADAVQLYHRAARIARGTDRRRAIEWMLEAARQAGDKKSEIDAALLMLEIEPDYSFGSEDYLVAQAVVGQLRANNPNHVIRWTDDAFNPLLRLAERRLSLFLDGQSGTAEQRTEAAKVLAEVRAEMRHEPIRLDEPTEERPGPQLPQGTAEQLLAIAANESERPWQRGLAAIAAGRSLKSAGQETNALEAFRLALAQMRRVYPFYDGIGNVFTSAEAEEATIQIVPSQESRWVHEVAREIEQLDSTSKPLTSGGIRFRITGIDIPKNVSVGLWVYLTDPDLPKNERRLYPDATGSFDVDEVPVAKDQTAWIGVVPGVYRLNVRQGTRGLHGDQNRDLYRRMKLDFDQLPQEVTVDDKVQELTIPARLLHDIQMLSPAAGEPVDLASDAFRWTEVPNAHSYHVLFTVFAIEASGQTRVESGPSVTVDRPPLRLKDVTVPDWAKAAMKPGTAMTWRVTAYDSRQREIGTGTEGERAFVVAEELP